MTSQPCGTPPADPPDLPGYHYIRPLGRGGTSSVYLYEQESPSRPVAVKASAYSQATHGLFLREADYLARLSTHPYILTIHQAVVSRDGRDCLILEFASGGNCKTIMRSTRLNEEQTLDLGVRMASALYSAHTKGIIHRDVKPGNFLITEQGLPVLSDFGISASTYGTAEARGLSIPWAAPEILANSAGGSEASDIYSLGASLFGMLTGQSPFEYGYQVANEDQLAQAIMHQRLPSLHGGEASVMFEQVLDRAMAHDRDDRYYTALDFGRAMQKIQQKLYGHMTSFIGDGVAPFPDKGDGGHTTGLGIDAGRDGLSDATDVGSQGRLYGDAGQARNGGRLSGKWVRPVLAAGATLLAVTLVVGLFVLPDIDSIRPGAATTAPGNETSTTIPETTNTEGPIPRNSFEDHTPVPSVVGGSGTYQGAQVVFTWDNPDPQPGDTYVWHPLADQGSRHGSTAQTNEPSAVLPQAEGTQTCIAVSLVRADQRVSQEPTTICATQ